MADLELILRFFAMSELVNRPEVNNKQINLAKYLNGYMGDKTKVSNAEIAKMEEKFINMIKTCKNVFGGNAFKNLKSDFEGFTNKINPALFDAISVATAYVIERKVLDEKINYLERYVQLLKKEEFKELISRRTTNVSNIMARINMASLKIYGVEYEK